MKIALLNTTICTGGAGSYYLTSITLEDAKAVLAGADVTSYIGHDSTAQVMSTLLEIPVPMNRAQFKQDHETVALCFKLNGRPEEGKILTAEEIEAIGYEWYGLTFSPPPTAMELGKLPFQPGQTDGGRDQEHKTWLKHS